MHNALLEAHRLTFDTVQVFTKNQQQWSAKPLDPAAIKEFRHHADRLGFEKIVAHASYLINLAAADPAIWDKSVRGFLHEMERCNQLHIPYLVIHPGAHVGAGEAAGIEKIITALNHLLEAGKSGTVTVCLETTAGQGSCLGCKFEQLAEMIAGIKQTQKHRIAVCVDTCHILAAGYDITTTESTRKMLHELDRVIGLKLVKVWHFNDSKKPLGSHVDRHEHIGRGQIGLECFNVLCTDPRLKNIPKILETPKGKAPDQQDWDTLNLAVLRSFAR